MMSKQRRVFLLATAIWPALGCGHADSTLARGPAAAGAFASEIAGVSGLTVAGSVSLAGPAVTTDQGGASGGNTSSPSSQVSAGSSAEAGSRAGSAGRGVMGNGSGGAAGSGTTGGSAGKTGGAAGSVGNAGSAAGSAGSSAPGSIWMPKPGVTWQWQLTGTLDTSVDAAMYDIDLFATSNATIQALHAAGRHVICYFSAGSYEPDRPDSDALAKTGLGSTLDGWPDEKWLDIRSSAVRDIMKARLDLAASKGCDGVEPDNVDGFDNSNGLNLTQQNQQDYNQFLATEAHARKLSVGLKNCLALVPKLVASFDWALNEECLKYDECDSLAPFISAGKAVFHCEYGKTTSGICDKKPQGFSTIVKNLDLDAFRLACP
jgi:Glycoside-hydrolase family GH114